MSKKFTFILTFLLIFSLLGCSTNKEQIAKPKQQTKAPITTIALGPSFDKSAVMKPSGDGVPVLMYHSVAFEKNNPVRITPQKLDEQMKYLKENGYYTITLNDLYSYLTKNTPIPKKSVVLTFDDGYKDNYTAMFPILKKYGFRATIFVITGYVDKLPGYLTSKQLKELQAYGIDIESHTVDHKMLKQLPKNEQLKELTDSKAFLQKLLNKKVNYIAYPDGSYNKDTIASAKEAGYIMAFTTDGRWATKGNGILTLDRDYISGFFNMSVFKDRITNPYYKFTN